MVELETNRHLLPAAMPTSAKPRRHVDYDKTVRLSLADFGLLHRNEAVHLESQGVLAPDRNTSKPHCPGSAKGDNTK
jgi:hypothetical protein